MEIRSICVIGGGRMGRQIALNAAIYGFKAVVNDMSEAVCADVEKWANEYLAERIAKGRMTEEKVAEIKSLFSVEHDMAKAVKDVDCVVEAIIEVEDVKHKLFKQISDLVSEDTIIATNSSAMVSSKFVDDVKNPARLCNMHYYNPALVLKFVEVVQGEHTDPETARACYEFCLKTGKKPVWMKKEIAGFLGNYINGGMSARAKQVVHEGYCTPQDVDTAMEYGFGHKMGPFRTNDLTGLDLSYDMMKERYERTGEKPVMFDFYEKMVKEGRLGRKTGRGFYDYDKDPNGTIPADFLPSDDGSEDSGAGYKEIKRVAVVGGGRMGRQIALNAAICGYPVAVWDISEEACADVEKWADEYLAERIAKGRMTAETVAEIKGRFRVDRDLAKAVEGVDCIIEAIIELEEAKREMFRKLSDMVPEDVIIATNASVHVSSKFANDVKNPARLCNMHYYNPALVMKFVEIVQGPHTSAQTARACYEFCLKTGKKPAWLRKELAGFLGNYIIGALNERSMYLVQEGYCTPQDVDTAMEHGFGHKMGPFRTNDLTGIDVRFARMKATYEKTGVKGYMYDIYEDMVKKGHIGRKSGKGFYDYT